MLLTLITGLAMGQAPPPIYGGQDASIDEVPWMVALLDGEEVVCGGVLIAPDVVLTAAHCTITADEVLAGTSRLNGAGERRTITDVQRHPDWRSDTGLDVAVLALDAPLDGVESAPLADACSRPVETTDRVRVYGWGALGSDGIGSSEVLQVAELEIRDADCSETAGCRAGVPTGSELFAAAEDADACIGDSGGPMVDDDGYVVGIVSRGVVGGDACGQGGFYTRVDGLHPWLGEMLGDAAPETCASGCGCSHAESAGAGWVVVMLSLLMRLQRRRREAPRS